MKKKKQQRFIRDIKKKILKKTH